MIRRVEESSGGCLHVIVKVEESSGVVCDWEGGEIVRGRLRVIGRVEETSRGIWIESVEESSGSVCM